MIDCNQGSNGQSASRFHSIGQGGTAH